MISSGSNPFTSSTIYKEQMRHPHLALNSQKIEETNNKLIKNIDKITCNLNNSFTNTDMNIRELLEQLLVSGNKLDNIENSLDQMIKNISDLKEISNYLSICISNQNIILDKLNNVINKLAEFDVEEQNSDQIPKDWVSDSGSDICSANEEEQVDSADEFTQTNLSDNDSADDSDGD